MEKKVCFSEDKNTIHNLVVWSFAYRQSRKSDFHKLYLDRLRFERRIKDSEESLIKILDVNHRKKIYTERFE